MKKSFLAVLLVLTLLASMVSCNLIFGDVADEGNVTVVVEGSDGSFEVYKTYLENVENKDEGAKGVIENLRDRENNPLYLKMVNSTYGAYVSEIGSIKENSAEKMYVIVYTSVAADSYEGAATVEYDGTTLYQAGLGLSGMKVESGTVILFRLEKSPY